jgi:hypothetical protein
MCSCVNILKENIVTPLAKLESESHKGDQHASSSHRRILHSIFNQEEDKDDAIIEDHIVVPHEKYIGDEGTQEFTSSSFVDKGLFGKQFSLSNF